MCVAANLQTTIKSKYDSAIGAKYRERLVAAVDDETEFSAREFLSMLDECVRCKRANNGTEEESCSCFTGLRTRVASDTTSCASSPEEYGGGIFHAAMRAASSNAHPRKVIAYTTASAEDARRKAQDNDAVDAVEDEALTVRCTLCNHMIPLEILDLHSSTCQVDNGQPKEVNKTQEYEVELGSNGGSLGLTFTKRQDGRAQVTKLVPGGDAELENVMVGSVVVGVGDRLISTFNELMELSKTMPRPVKFRFEYTNEAVVLPTSQAVPEPVATERTVEFETLEIGIGLEEFHGMCCICMVQNGSEAEAKGVLVGWTISHLNGLTNPSLVAVQEALESTHRPLHLTFHHVEGVMRGWT